MAHRERSHPSVPTSSAILRVVSTASVESGLVTPNDTAKAVDQVLGCQYPFVWDSVDVQFLGFGCLPA